MTSTPSQDPKPRLVPDLVIRPVRAEDGAQLAGLTARNFAALLREGADNPAYCHLAAYATDVPVGLLLSRRDPDNPGRQEILSLMVTPLLRRQGVARALLAGLYARLTEAEVEEVAASWSDRLPQLESFIGLLLQDGWGEPEPQRLRMSFNVRDALEALSLARRPVARARATGLTSVSLATLGKDGWSSLLAAASGFHARGLLPGWADPAPWESRIDPAVSQVLLSADGSVAGWLLGEEQPALKRHAAPIGWSNGLRDGLFLAAQEWLLALEARAGSGATLILQPTYRNGERVASLLDRHFRPNALWADQLVMSVRPLRPDPSSSARRGSSM